jgi:glycosyltransferase involved in cell wall biosynthesis
VPPRVLVVATSAPWPAARGGSLAVASLVEALAAAGLAVRLVAPAAATVDPAPLLRPVAARPRPWVRAAGGRLLGLPAAVNRYKLRALAAALDDEIASFRPDVVHVEQIHLGWLIPLLAGRLPVVLRQQNVESDLLGQLARLAPPVLAAGLRLEARALARFEAEACRRADLVAAISRPDAAAFRRIAPGANVEVLPPVGPAAIGAVRERLAGDPPFLALGSFDWWPNRDGARWLVSAVWPPILAALPGARLHLAGHGSSTLGRGVPGVIHRGFVASPGELYDPAATVLIPVRAASGVRMRLLEAWAAHVPAVSTPAGVAGLCDGDDSGVAVGEDAGAFAALAVRLARDSAMRSALVAAGAARLAGLAPARVAERALRLYETAIGAWREVRRP